MKLSVFTALRMLPLLLLTASVASAQTAGSGEEDSSIAAIEAETKNRLLTEQRRLVARYTDDLSILQKAQQDKGDTAGAAATAAEIARAKAALAEGGDPATLLASLGKPGKPADAPPAAAAAAIAADAPVEPDASRKAISLKPDNARSIGGTPWSSDGSGRVWTITEASAGLYTIVLTGSANREGTLSARLGASQRTSARFSPGIEEVTLGHISITTTPVELFVLISDFKGYSQNPIIDVRNLTLRPVKLSAPATPK